MSASHRAIAVRLKAMSRPAWVNREKARSEGLSVGRRPLPGLMSQPLRGNGMKQWRPAFGDQTLGVAVRWRTARYRPQGDEAAAMGRRIPRPDLDASHGR